MIQFQHISKIFERNGVKNQALKDITLEIRDGDIFGVIGYSGAGKSTLLRMVNALETPTSGKVIVDGEDLSKYSVKELRNIKKRIGMIFQHFNLLNSKTVYNNVAIPLILEKKSKKEIHQKVMELLEFVGLKEKAESYPDELSGGQKQRVGIARALALNPSILLCDEATSALDPKTTEQILELLKKVNREYKITILMITHEMGVIQKICNQVAVMEKGQIIERGTVLEVFSHPKQKTTKDFVDTVIQDHLPDHLKKQLMTDSKSRHFKITFLGDTGSRPLMNTLIQDYQVSVNIEFANMSEIQHEMVGHMVLQISGERESVDAAVGFLREQQIDVEEVAK
ncbi:ATP-binding cassette domain-containing protein [Sporolactobacillus sp. THM7-4]|nr:ATP-binding cassette domain-containing protein [Sporolactobacillus sp. THM7-4]